MNNENLYDSGAGSPGMGSLGSGVQQSNSNAISNSRMPLPEERLKEIKRRLKLNSNPEDIYNYEDNYAFHNSKTGKTVSKLMGLSTIDRNKLILAVQGLLLALIAINIKRLKDKLQDSNKLKRILHKSPLDYRRIALLKKFGSKSHVVLFTSAKPKDKNKFIELKNIFSSDKIVMSTIYKLENIIKDKYPDVTNKTNLLISISGYKSKVFISEKFSSKLILEKYLSGEELNMWKNIWDKVVRDYTSQNRTQN